jgi:hypothetical protein
VTLGPFSLALHGRMRESPNDHARLGRSATIGPEGALMLVVDDDAAFSASARAAKSGGLAIGLLCCSFVLGDEPSEDGPPFDPPVCQVDGGAV